MAKAKFDGVIEAARFTPDGKLAFVRAYERRGPTFSDRVMLDRATLVDRLKAGKKFVLGQRVAYLSSTFEVSHPVRLEQLNGAEVVIAGNPASAKSDALEGVLVV